MESHGSAEFAGDAEAACCGRLWAAVMQVLRLYPVSVGVAITGWGAMIGLSLAPEATCVTGPDSVDECLYSASYLVLSFLLGALLLMVNDAAPDLVMLAFSVLLVLSRVITDSEAWAGCSSTSVLSIAALFVVARALEETRTVETIMSPLLGRPSGNGSALVRMCVPVTVFSAFLNNTPIVAMMIPVCEGWAAEAGLSIKILLMPLSFASMLGGMCTLIGTSTNLVLNAQIEADADAPVQPLGMFSMTIVAAPSVAVGILYLAIASPIVFGPRPAATAAGDEDTKATHDAPTESQSPSTDPCDVELSLEMRVSQPSLVRSIDDSESVATVMSNTRFVSCGSTRYLVEALITPACATLIGKAPGMLGKLVAPSCVAQMLIRAGHVHVLGRHRQRRQHITLEPHDRLLIACLADCAQAMLQVPGLQLRPDDTSDGEHAAPADVKSNRWLVEASIALGSPLIGTPLDDARNSFLNGAQVWAIRQRKEVADLRAQLFGRRQRTSLSSRRASSSSARKGSLGSAIELHASQSLGTTKEDAKRNNSTTLAAGPIERFEEDLLQKVRGEDNKRCLRAGDTLLLEAPEYWIQTHAFSPFFAGMRRVAERTRAAPASTPHTRVEDGFKFAASIASMLLILILTSLNVASLFPLALTISYLLVAIKCITLDQAWGAISYRLLLTIACSFGPGAALTNTNVAPFLGALLAKLTVLGNFGFLLSIFLVTSVVSSLVSNAATVVAFYSVLRVLRVPGLRPEQMLITMMLGASSAFATPIGYQTNLMVLARGGYIFTDFLAIGGGLTLVVGACVSAMSLFFL